MPHDTHRSLQARSPQRSRPRHTPLLLLATAALTATTLAAGPPAPPDPLQQRPAKLWATEAAAAELRALNHTGPYLRYRMHLIDRKGDQLRDEIETHDGTVARLIERDGHPLSHDEDVAERDRLNALIASPDDFFKHIHNDRSERKTAADLIQLLPDAMLYTYTPGQPQLPGIPHRQIVLDFAPNPNWSPPTTPSEALTGLRGRPWIDADAPPTVRLEGNVFRPVNVGWGMLAHIYPGGTFTVQQTNPGNGSRWIYTHFEQSLTVRALMFKSMDIHGKVDATGRTLRQRLDQSEASFR